MVTPEYSSYSDTQFGNLPQYIRLGSGKVSILDVRHLNLIVMPC